MTCEQLFKQLRGRCPVKQLSLNDEICNYSGELYEELTKIKEYNPYYVKTVLKTIIDKSIDIEWIYEEYMKVLNVSPPTGGNYEDIIEYPLSNDVTIKIWEKPKLISCLSTTGFRTWEAALYLCIYFSTMKLDDNTTFLELGAGTGLVSMFLYKQLHGQCKNYITDGDTNLLEDSLLKNLRLNEIASKQIIRQRLIWNEDKNIPLDVNILIGADITYDSSYFPQLCQCIHDFLHHDESKCKEMIISCTVRSEETLAAFRTEISKVNLTIELVSNNDPEIIAHMESILYKKLIAPIHVYRIIR
ncbi:protein-lysine N-methyltransferase Efm3p [Monosporozyma unispora]|nr:hypothetical protein C6P44_004312 [Kazachstania unispora]